MVTLDARRLREERLARMMTATELSRLSGAGRDTINSIEAKGRKPRPETIRGILEALGLGADEARRIGLLVETEGE
jgi:transcriptional regulator with XRE-family HTH domain